MEAFKYFTDQIQLHIQLIMKIYMYNTALVFLQLEPSW